MAKVPRRVNHSWEEDHVRNARPVRNVPLARNARHGRAPRPALRASARPAHVPMERNRRGAAALAGERQCRHEPDGKRRIRRTGRSARKGNRIGGDRAPGNRLPRARRERAGRSMTRAGPGRGDEPKSGRAMGILVPRAREGIALVRMRHAARGNESRSGRESKLRSSREPLRADRVPNRITPPARGGLMRRNPGRGTVIRKGRRPPERRARRAAGMGKALPARRSTACFRERVSAPARWPRNGFARGACA